MTSTGCYSCRGTTDHPRKGLRHLPVPESLSVDRRSGLRPSPDMEQSLRSAHCVRTSFGSWPSAVTGSLRSHGDSPRLGRRARRARLRRWLRWLVATRTPTPLGFSRTGLAHNVGPLCDVREIPTESQTSSHNVHCVHSAALRSTLHQGPLRPGPSASHGPGSPHAARQLCCTCLRSSLTPLRPSCLPWSLSRSASPKGGGHGLSSRLTFGPHSFHAAALSRCRKAATQTACRWLVALLR